MEYTQDASIGYYPYEGGITIIESERPDMQRQNYRPPTTDRPKRDNVLNEDTRTSISKDLASRT
jgi:hypothetical protein